MRKKNLFEHFLITRINIGYIERSNQKKLNPDYWLNSRVKIFFDFCLNSILNQSEKQFIWILLLDIRTPESIKIQFSELQKLHPFIKLFYMHGGFEMLQENVQRAILNNLMEDSKFIISSRVDTDDLLHKDYIKKVQECFYFQEFAPLNFNKGLIYHIPTGVLGHSYQYSNSFISLIEKINTFKFNTVFCKKHREYLNHKNLIGINTKEYMWCVTVHGLNVSSGFFGIPFMFKNLDLKNEFSFQNLSNSNFKYRITFLYQFYKRKFKKIIPFIKRKLNFI